MLAWSWNVPASAAIISSADAPSFSICLNSGDNLPRAVVEPAAAFAIASVTVLRLLPVPWATSIAIDISSCALVTSWVWDIKRPSAGLSSSSVMPSALPCWLIQFSVAVICSSVAPVVLRIVKASFACAASSAMASLVALNNAVPKPAIAAAAGTAAFLIAN